MSARVSRPGGAQAPLPVILEEGACRWLPPSLKRLFFPSQPREDEKVLLWKSACSTCSVRVPCFDQAVAHEDYWIWAGTTEADRRHLRADEDLLEYARNRVKAGYLPLPRRWGDER